MLQSTAVALVATSVVLALATIISVYIQVERQYKTTGRLNASKWFLVASAFFALVMTSLVCAAAAEGLGAPISAEEFRSRPVLQKLILAAFPPYFICNMLVKHAWLTFYYGLATTRPRTYFIHFMQFVAATFGISSVLVVLLQCIPLSSVWNQGVDPTETPDQCINVMAFFYANSIIMIVNDVVMYLMPMWLLRNVDMLRGHRIGIYALFGAGGIVVIASIFRLVAVNRMATTDNLSESYALIWIWAAVENHVGICAACGGAIKQRTIAAYASVRRSYSDLRYKMSSTSSINSRAKCVEASSGRSESTSTKHGSYLEGDLHDKSPSLEMDEKKEADNLR
ncbi:hypothetical protein B0A52_04506 [Exophiala mesophila]|uniref:Rhodopsin domain-containing protein n=1 Tax=Exophiala mesophila TaxID=212818 RepID=A0A438N9K3_EXOME|nr:hypothetical protein B0A52_04506 [Exophiala mesophila]